MRTLEITTLIGCPVNCAYCPQKKLFNAYTQKHGKEAFIMTLDGFKKYLKNVPKDVRIDFSGFAEPFANIDVYYMMSYADSKGYKIGVYTTLYDFDFEKLYLIENIEFERFVIHLKKNFTKDHHRISFKGDLKKLVESGIDLSYVAIDEVPEEYKPIIDKGINKVELISRAGSVKEMEEKTGDLKCARSKDFSQNVLLPNGAVYLCCMDYGLEHYLGNLKETNYNNLNREPHYKLCNKCELAK